jgi:hypothetical protein
MTNTDSVYLTKASGGLIGVTLVLVAKTFPEMSECQWIIHSIGQYLVILLPLSVTLRASAFYHSLISEILKSNNAHFSSFWFHVLRIVRQSKTPIFNSRYRDAVSLN